MISTCALLLAVPVLNVCSQHWVEASFAIKKEDAAFIATDVVRRDGGLAFRLNTDDLVIAGPGHRLRAAGSADSPAIYLGVRRGCEARLNRSTWLQLAEIALAEGDGTRVTSGGETFSLMPG